MEKCGQGLMLEAPLLCCGEGGRAPASSHPCLACSSRIMRLQDELVTLRLECTNLYRKGHFSTLELVPSSMLSTMHLKGESLTKGLHTSSASWFRKPMTRTELVAISSSEDEGSLRFVYELLAWVEEMQVSAGSLGQITCLRSH